MDKEEINKLIAKFNSGELNERETALLEKLIEEGVIDFNDVEGLREINSRIGMIPVPEPGKRLDERFYASLSDEKLKQPGRETEMNPLVVRLSIAASILIAGFFIGFLTHYLGSKREMNKLSDEIGRMNETMMIALIEKPSATERLKAVNLTSRIEEANSRVVEALLNTLNYDDNVNIRLAAVEALAKYADFEQARMGMVEAIVNQDSPLVQVALAEVMVALQEKSSVINLKILLSREDLNEDVKVKISESIKEII
ncbi:MAG TPA: HEAT repeat domain-containing protein [Cyclobacteriaceae bacterium]|nr:HEAT repeat domain-containing protein [Cyclobacteriaceae bacterium]